MASCCYSYECQEIQRKKSFDKILSWSFDLRHLQMNKYCVKKSKFCKLELSKGLI
jgi:hypothetical protein